MEKKTLLIKSIHLMQKKVILLGALMLSCGVLQADWDPNALENVDIHVLSDQRFKEVKISVTKYVTNSWCSAEKTNLLMDLVLLTKPEVCVEIGAFKGSSVLPVAATLKYLGRGKMYAIDAWSNAEAIKYLEDNDSNKAWWAKVNMKEIYYTFQKMIQEWALNPYCTMIRNTSEQAALQVDSIDFLHLDGDLSETGSLRDVSLYLPKVKSGGYIVLSNLFHTVNGKQPKVRAFCALFESCEMICEIDNDNTILFRKR